MSQWLIWTFQAILVDVVTKALESQNQRLSEISPLSIYFANLKIKGNRNATLCDKVGFNVFLVDFYVLLYMENFPRVSGFCTLFSMSLTFLNIFDYFGHHIQSKTSHESIVITFEAYETKFTNPSHTFQKL